MNERMQIAVRGVVQGVGFRPFVYRLAKEIGLAGTVSNTGRGVVIEIEGERGQLDSFLVRLTSEHPPRASIQSVEPLVLDPVGHTGFSIIESTDHGKPATLIMPDIATCPDCLREIFSMADRRFLYPFTNCTNCGPRYSIIESLPYDRCNTTMKIFPMCETCAAEYHDPANRRFHAQPTACPDCGPEVQLWNPAGEILGRGPAAISDAVSSIRAGQVVAMKGLGGFHLMVDARNDEAVARLRNRKHREEKPFALLFPDLPSVNAVCEISPVEERLLHSAESPIVLLRKRPGISGVASAVAPRNPCLGVMLPYTPLHHILMHELQQPIIATSGNLSDETICTDEHEALERLAGVADIFLVHNRPIRRPVDDSIVRVLLGREQVLRRARGYAPLPVSTGDAGEQSLLAVGGHMKNSVSLSNGEHHFVSQHIGDLESNQSRRAFSAAVSDIRELFDISPAIVVCDMHPDYHSTVFASESGLPGMKVQHHYAHVMSCMSENQLNGPVLGVSWDGTGYGTDGTVWGGEFLLTDEDRFSRVATFRSFMLPGNEYAVREPRRSALGLLYEVFGGQVIERRDLAPVNALRENERTVLSGMMESRLNSPRTTSVGRLFDAVASITGLCQKTSFEGQAAMELEFAIDSTVDEEYPFEIRNSPAGSGLPAVVDWEQMIRTIIADIASGKAVGEIARRFHNTLAEIVVSVARRTGVPAVLLTGGCFQNRYLTERTVSALRGSGFRPYWHQRVPPNDGGISLGQIAAARKELARRARRHDDIVVVADPFNETA